MQSVDSIPASNPMRERLSFRLALLFVLSFLAGVVVMGAYSLFGMVAERAAADELSVPPPVVVIDPKIHQDLSKALAFDAIPTATQVQNPFVDRAGLSGTSGVLASTISRPIASPSSGAAGRARSGASSAGNTSIIPGIGSSGGAELVYTAPADATKSRYEEWLGRQKRGEFVGPESEVLGVEDLVPVGYAAGGSRAAEVLLLSVSLCRTFSFPAGTRFYDGMLNGFDQREVMFVFGNGIRRKSYLNGEPCQPVEAPGSAATAN